jgi:thioredoxin 2
LRTATFRSWSISGRRGAGLPRDGTRVRAAAGRVEPAARFAKVNTDDAQDIAARCGIRSIPTLMVFKGGRETAPAGAMNAGSFDRWLKSGCDAC